MSYVAETEKDYGVVRDQMIMMLDILFTRIIGHLEKWKCTIT